MESLRDIQSVLNAADISKIKGQSRAGEEIIRQQATLNSLINAMPDLIFYMDCDGHFLGCNTAFAQAMGKSVDEIAGRSQAEVLGTERAAVVRERDKDLMRTLEPTVREEWLNFPGRPPVLLETLKAPFWDKDGQLTGVMGIGRDITQRKKIEEDIRHAKDLAEEATRVKSHFLANMSHEIRTPMNAVIGLAHLMLKTELNPRQREYLQKIQDSGQHLMGIINDILDFSKVEADELVLDSSGFELDRLVKTVTDQLAEKCIAKAIALVLKIDPDVPRHLVGDPLRLSQVLINFTNNAVKFTKQGEIVISVHMHRLLDDGVMLRFCVRDSGIGMAPEQMKRLFERFQQGDASTTRKFGGTGLGLAISKKLAALMGGEVGVESRPGEGSTFWFTALLGRQRLALEDNNEEPGSKDGKVALAAIQGGRVLLVEDNDINQIVASEILTDAGLVVDIAADGRIALNMVQAKPYDIVLMDLQMPVMGGFEATMEIRKLDRFQALPIVAMTANAMAQDRQRCVDAGMNDFLSKPIEPDELWRVLLQWTRREMAVSA